MLNKINIFKNNLWLTDKIKVRTIEGWEYISNIQSVNTLIGYNVKEKLFIPSLIKEFNVINNFENKIKYTDYIPCLNSEEVITDFGDNFNREIKKFKYYKGSLYNIISATGNIIVEYNNKYTLLKCKIVE